MQTPSRLELGLPPVRRRWLLGAPIPSARPAKTGFSLIEMLGVMAISMIVCVALVPALMRQMAKASLESEADNLRQISGALQSFIVNRHIIPAAGPLVPGTGLVVFTNIANELGWPLGLVLSNASGNPRYYLVDQDIGIGTNTYSKLPYVQTNHFLASTHFPTNARVLFITSLGAPLPTGVTNASAFDMIWNGPDFTMPSGWSYGGDWGNILVQRLDLSRLFTKLVLNNHSSLSGQYSIDNTNVVRTLPTTSGTNYSGWLLLRTAVGLFSSNTAAPVLQTIQILQESNTNLYNALPGYAPAFCFDRGVWRGRAFASSDAQSRTSLDLQAASDLFLSGFPNLNTNGLAGASPSNVVYCMWSYMSNYVSWASNNTFGTGTKSNAVYTAQTSLATALANYCRTNARNP